MFNQFKSRYPKGRFIIEIISHSRDGYLVRVTLIVNEKQISARGQASTQELAQKLAGKKALLILELESNYINQLPEESDSQRFDPSLNLPHLKAEIESLERSLRKAEMPSVNEEKSEFETMDIAEIIKGIEREIQRLRWTNDDERNYLKKTYSKRSRHILTDGELFQFWHFLKSLPSP